MIATRYGEQLFDAFATGWTGPFTGERGGTYWLSPTGKPSYDEPAGEGGQTDDPDEGNPLNLTRDPIPKAGPEWDSHIGEWKSHIVENYGQWGQSQQPAVRGAVTEYVAHPWVNEYLRGGKLPDAAEIKRFEWTTGNKKPKSANDAIGITKTIDAAFASVPPTTQPIKTYRWLDVTDDGPSKKLFDGLVSGSIKPGSVIEDKAYQSTSYGGVIANVGPSPAVIMRIKVPRGAKAIPTEVFGVNSQSEDQRELILPRGAKYLVTGTSRKNGAVVVDVEYVLPANPPPGLAKRKRFLFFAEGWQGPFEGERGGRYWISPTGERDYTGPQSNGAGNGTTSRSSKPPDARKELDGLTQAAQDPKNISRVAATISQRLPGLASGIAGAPGDREADSRRAGQTWTDSAAGVDPATRQEMAGRLTSIASDTNAASVGSKVKQLGKWLLSLPVKAFAPLFDAIKQFARSSLRVAGAVGLHLGGIALGAGIIAASVLASPLVPPAVALLAAFPIGYGVKKIITATGRKAGNLMDPAQKGYSEFDESEWTDFAGRWMGPFKGKLGGTFWVTPAGNKTYTPPTHADLGKTPVKLEPEARKARVETLRAKASALPTLKAKAVAAQESMDSFSTKAPKATGPSFDALESHLDQHAGDSPAARAMWANKAERLAKRVLERYPKGSKNYGEVATFARKVIITAQKAKAAHLEYLIASREYLKEKGRRVGGYSERITHFAEPIPTDQVALAGPDGKRAAELLKAAKHKGMLTLHYLTRRAIARLLDEGNPEDAKTLFDDDELQVLTDSLASVTGTANLLGRSRIRERADQAELVEQGVREFGEADSFEVFGGSIPALALGVDADHAEAFADPPPPIPPENAINYFQRLVPALNVPAGFVSLIGERAFTMAAATDLSMLNAVKRIIANTLASGDTTGKVADIQDLLDAAGVTPKNPQYAENVYRTNMMEAYNNGSQEEMDDPLMQEFFPVWQYAGIADGRQGDDHAPRFCNGSPGNWIETPKYYPSIATFDEVRGERKYNCRCSAIWLSKYAWRDLQANGAKLETEW